MNRSITIGNKTTYQRTTNKNYTLHLERLQKIKSKTSQTLQLQNHNSHLLKSVAQLHTNNKKKELEAEVNNIKIDRENKILLDKMTKIVGTKTYRNGIAQNNTTNGTMKPEPRAKSLNEHVRKQEIERIMVENQGIIHRLQQQHSVYNVNKWEKDNKMRETYLKNMAGFSLREGFINAATERTMRKTCITTTTAESPIRRASIGRIGKGSISIKNSIASLPSVHHSRSDSIAKKLTLYKKEVQIGGQRYFIEFTTIEKNLQVALYRIDNPEVKYITLDEHKALRVLVENNNDYEQIIKKIEFVNDDPVIKGLETSAGLGDNKKIELFNSFKTDEAEPKVQNTHNTEPQETK